MLYELTDNQVENLKIIISDANIKWAMVPLIGGLLQALGNPVNAKPKEEIKEVK